LAEYKLNDNVTLVQKSKIAGSNQQNHYRKVHGEQRGIECETFLSKVLALPNGVIMKIGVVMILERRQSSQL
jgi:hypothetical protein